ncbi:MAG: cytochrome c oxidase subunit II [Thermoplasmatota archaeon]
MRVLLPAASLAVACALVRGADLAGAIPIAAARAIETSLFLLFLGALAVAVPWAGWRSAIPTAAALALALAFLQRVVSFAPTTDPTAPLALGMSYGPVTLWPSLSVAVPALDLHGSLTLGRALLLGFTALVLAMALRDSARDAIALGGAGGSFVSACSTCPPTALALAAVAGMPLDAPKATSLLATTIDLALPLAAVMLLMRPRLHAPLARIAAWGLPLLALGGLASGTSDVEDRIQGLYLVFTVAAVVITGAFLALLVFATIRGSRRAEAAPWASLGTRRRVTLAFTLGVLGLLLALLALSLHAQRVIEAPAGPDAYHVNVTAIQFGWRFTYPNGSSTLNVLRLPVGHEVALDVTSTDVAHSLFIPDLGIQVNAIPGRINSGHFRVYRAGEWLGHCSEYCGIGHSDMDMRVIASA